MLWIAAAAAFEKVLVKIVSWVAIFEHGIVPRDNAGVQYRLQRVSRAETRGVTARYPSPGVRGERPAMHARHGAQ